MMTSAPSFGVAIDVGATLTGVPSNAPLAVVRPASAEAPKAEVIAAPVPLEGAFSLEKLKRQRSDYVSSKREERKEAQEARRYYHADQWSSDEIRTQNARGQPVITYNRIAKKINGTVGLVERLRQDPKAFSRTPEHQDGADIATATLNYVLDSSAWKTLSSTIAREGAIEAVTGIELSLEPGDRGDLDVRLHDLDPDTIFYDPRSRKADLSDAAYIGIDKFVRLDEAVEMFPDFAERFREMASNGAGSYDDLADSERQHVWSKTEEKSIRLVEHWYKSAGQWLWCFYTVDLKLDEGPSPFVDERGDTFCRFILFSANVDHDNDRYGFVRNLKGPQDEINHRRAKGLHGLNTVRIYVDEAIDEDRVELIRAEIHKPSGVIRLPRDATVNEKSNAEQVAGNLQMLQEAKQELEGFGPNPQLVGGGSGDQSGRAIQLLQQAGIAELGPYIIAFRDWKLRVYRAVWNLVQRHWTAERWIRVTDHEGLAEFIRLNGLGFDPRTGRPTLENALGTLDVDIIVDEGPDHVTLMEDTLEALTSLARLGVPVPPEVIVHLANMPAPIKKTVLGLLEQAKAPNPLRDQAEQLQLRDAAAKIGETEARTSKLQAEAAAAAPDAITTGRQREADTRKKHADAAAQELDTALRFLPPVPAPFGPVERAFAQGAPARF